MDYGYCPDIAGHNLCGTRVAISKLQSDTPWQSMLVLPLRTVPSSIIVDSVGTLKSCLSRPLMFWVKSLPFCTTTTLVN